MPCQETELTPRQKFCLETREGFKPQILSVIPGFVEYCDIDTVHIERNVTFPFNGLGAEKFGDTWKHIVHSGRVLLGFDVTIMTGATIMRATKDWTTIGSGTIIGVNAQIGHNVKIGTGCLIGSRTLICGSAVIGRDVEIGAGAMIRNKVNVGKGAVIGMGAVVVKDVEPGTVVAGCPAKEIGKEIFPTGEKKHIEKFINNEK